MRRGTQPNYVYIDVGVTGVTQALASLNRVQQALAAIQSKTVTVTINSQRATSTIGTMATAFGGLRTVLLSAAGAMGGFVMNIAKFGLHLALLPVKMMIILEAFRVAMFIVDMPKKIAAAFKDIVAVTGEYQLLRQGLAVIMQSADAASEHFKELQEVAKLPGIDTEQALRWSLAMQAVGFSSNFAARSAVEWSNALASAGRSASELPYVSLALTQIGQAAFNYGQELRQFREHIPQFGRALVELYGTSRSEDLVKMGITGRQIAVDVTNWMGTQPRAPTTLTTALENLTDALGRFKEAIGAPIIGRIQTFLQRIADVFDYIRKNTKIVSQFWEALSNGLILATMPMKGAVSYQLGGLVDYAAIFLAIIEKGISALPGIIHSVAGLFHKLAPVFVDILNYFKISIIPVAKSFANILWVAGKNLTVTFLAMVEAVKLVMLPVAKLGSYLPGDLGKSFEILHTELSKESFFLGNGKGKAGLALGKSIMEFGGDKLPFENIQPGEPIKYVAGKTYAGDIPKWLGDTLGVKPEDVAKWRKLIPQAFGAGVNLKGGTETGAEAQPLAGIAKSGAETARNTRIIADKIDWAVRGYGVSGTEGLMPSPREVARWGAGEGAINVVVQGAKSFEQMLADLVSQTVSQMKRQGAFAR